MDERSSECSNREHEEEMDRVSEKHLGRGGVATCKMPTMEETEIL